MVKKLTENPTIVDTILFELETPGVNGLLTADPATVDRVVIYHIKSDFGKINKSKQTNRFNNPALSKKLKNLREEVRTNPSTEKMAEFNHVKQHLNATSIEHTFYFQEATPVFVLGTKENPAWFAEDPMKSGLKAFVQNEQGEQIFGRFSFEWKQDGLLEGNYYILWQWTTWEGEKLSQVEYFTLDADKQVKTAQPHRYTPQDKYDMLLRLYIPPMYNNKLKHTDITPEVLGKLNSCIAKGFTSLEDSANRLIDALDPASAHESMLPLLANLFNLRLQSSDPTRWRRQIKRAVPLCKRKGTLAGLYEALDQAGVNLLKVTKLWQVTSAYQWTDAVVVGNDSIDNVGGQLAGHTPRIIGKLSHVPADGYLKVSVRDSEGKFMHVPSGYVQIVMAVETTEKPIVIWQGEVDLFKNDVVLITYKLQDIPDDQRTVEDYIQTLPLADDKEDTHPLKNWNVRLIEDDDPLFDIIVKTRHPFTEPVAYGKVRTTFLYSEKAYNMDTYDGSLRDSYSPCDIDSTFVDRCTYCQSSKFNVDLEIENLSSQRLEEAKEIIQEYSPFHAVLHSINLTGAINEFIVSPQEDIECLLQGNTVTQTKVKNAETITYEVEWRDGSKEKGSVN